MVASVAHHPGTITEYHYQTGPFKQSLEQS